MPECLDTSDIIRAGGGALNPPKKGAPMGWDVPVTSWLPVGKNLNDFPRLVRNPRREHKAKPGVAGCKAGAYHHLWKCPHVGCKPNKKHPAQHDHHQKKNNFWATITRWETVRQDLGKGANSWNLQLIDVSHARSIPWFQRIWDSLKLESGKALWHHWSCGLGLTR